MVTARICAGAGRARRGRGAGVITVVAFGLTAELNNRLHCGAREQRVGAIKVSFGDSIGRQTRLALRGPRNARAPTAGGAVSGAIFGEFLTLERI
ncbi:hypothetical protein EVAR_21112_1 [Eumeta japonica]|uniref:Uncharacterized protein n=1 Tax=Eumeta variegata TaxID=151549 RepID=A0A4C1VSM5_EUMVA|nr:hypothetical protein EVAR_21112_1 [Eumeta japonica]